MFAFDVYFFFYPNVKQSTQLQKKWERLKTTKAQDTLLFFDFVFFNTAGRKTITVKTTPKKKNNNNQIIRGASIAISENPGKTFIVVTWVLLRENKNTIKKMIDLTIKKKVRI